jgi:hypothetical protein
MAAVRLRLRGLIAVEELLDRGVFVAARADEILVCIL